MNFLTTLSNKSVTTKNFVVNPLHILRSLYISYDDMGMITGFLKHNPHEWGYIHRAHPQFNKTIKDITELMPYVRLNNPLILVHFEANWLIILDNDEVLPVILQFNPNCRDGLCVAFYRLINGKSLHWLPQIPAYCLAIIDLFDVPVSDPIPAVLPTAPEPFVWLHLDKP